MPARKKVDRTEFARLHEQGLTQTQLAAHFGVNPATIWRTTKTLGLNTAPRMTPERRARIQQMLNDGWSWKEIERTEGANWDTMRRHFPGTQWTRQQIINQSTITRHARENMRTTNYATKAA
ncbi:MAG: helix-turn-helix domain-containing protein [Arthrobacter sp.]